MNTFNSEAKKLTNALESDVHKFGSRTAEKIGAAVDQAGAKVDAAVEYVSERTQKAKNTLDQVRQEGWNGVKRRTSDLARKEPLTAILLAAGVGLLTGWLVTRCTQQD